MGKQAVSVIGLGPMGQAMAGAFLDAGHPVTVWNRTPARADALVARGARRAPTVAAALAAGDPTILSLTDYDAVDAVLGQARDALAGRVIVNLTSDTPRRARESAERVTALGGTVLTGGVRVPPTMVGRPGASTYYGGPADVFAAYRDTLAVLSGTDHRGDDPGLALLYYQLQMDLFWPTVIGFLHAVALADVHGIPATDLVPMASETMAMMPMFLPAIADRVVAGDHPGDLARLTMDAASIEHVAQTTRDAGVDATLPAALSDIIARGVTAGHGGESFSALINILRPPS